MNLNQNEFVKQFVEFKLFSNLTEQVIITTEDKVKLCLQKHLKRAEKKHDWFAPAGILFAIITAFVTASFKDFYFSAKTWEALFIICGILSSIWLLSTLKSAFDKIEIENIIEELKKQ